MNYDSHEKKNNHIFQNNSSPFSSNTSQFSIPGSGKPLSQKAVDLIADNLRDESQP